MVEEDRSITGFYGEYVGEDLIKQIETRSNIFAKEAKNLKEQEYLNANAPWIMLRSSVAEVRESTKADTADSLLPAAPTLRVTRTDTGYSATAVPVDTNQADASPQNKSKYSTDTSISQRNILVGGRMMGSGIDFTGQNRYQSAYSKDSSFGIRPMPGITGVSIKTLDTWGCILEANVNIKIWSKQDLEELSNVYFKLGFSALLEWGHSIYVDNDGTIQPMKADFIPNSVWFSEESLGNIDELISKKRKELCGNYDGMCGLVTNFSWKFNKDGSYDCTVKLLSRGSVISAIKGSAKDKIGIGDLSKLFEILCDVDTREYYKFGDSVPDAEIIGPEDVAGPYRIFDELTSRPSEKINSGKVKGSYETYSTTSTVTPRSVETDLAVDGTRVLSIGERRIKDKTKKTKGEKSLPDRNIRFSEKLQEPFELVSVVAGDSKYSKYIKLRDLLWIMQTLFDLKKTYGIGFNLHTPVRFVSFPGMFSLNPCIAMLADRGKKSLTLADGTVLSLETDGTRNYSITDQTDAFKDNAKDWKWNSIGSIYLNVDYLKNVFNVGEDSSVSADINLSSILNSILKDIQACFGNINDFGIHIENNVWTVVDRNYIDSAKQLHEEKYRIPVSGLKSTLTNFDVSSAVTNDIADSLSIAATGGEMKPGDLANIVHLRGDYRDIHRKPEKVEKELDESDSNVEVNDRSLSEQMWQYRILISSKGKSGIEDPREEFKAYYSYWSDIFNGIVVKSLVSSDDSEGALQTGIIPIQVSLTMKGISRFLIASCFEIEPGLVPSDYDDWGYLITGVSHEINNGGWTTTVKTQYYPVVPKLRETISMYVDMDDAEDVEETLSPYVDEDEDSNTITLREAVNQALSKISKNLNGKCARYTYNIARSWKLGKKFNKNFPSGGNAHSVAWRNNVERLGYNERHVWKLSGATAKEFQDYIFLMNPSGFLDGDIMQYYATGGDGKMYHQHTCIDYQGKWYADGVANNTIVYTVTDLNGRYDWEAYHLVPNSRENIS